MGALPEVACDILKDSDKEKAAVEMICEKESKVPKDECAAGLSKIWEVVSEKECAKAFKALPEVACDILKDSDKEKAAVEMACEKQSKVPADECAAGLSKIWELIAEKGCPKEKFSALPEVACDILKDSGKEKTAVEMVCEKQSKVPADECEAGLSKVWEMVAEKECAKEFEALPEVACDILKDSDQEKAAVEMVCEKQLKVPKDECAAGLSKIWEMITAKECPKTLKEKFAAKKEKFVGKFSALKEKKEVQTMFVSVLCRFIDPLSRHFPQLD